MTLNFQRLAAQLDGLGPSLRERAQEGQTRLAEALAALHAWAGQPQALRERLRTASTSWLLAEPLSEPIDAAFPPPAAPDEYVALASDGSHIDMERHSPVPCYLLNLGWARIRYGSQPQADLGSQPQLAFEDEELVLGDQADASHEDILAGNLLAALRSVREVDLLAHLAAQDESSLPTLALLDGTFVLWGLAQAALGAEVKRLLLDEGIIRALDGLKGLTAEGRLIALASYISRPNSSEVIHSLRLAVCPLPRGQPPQPVDCRRCPRQAGQRRPCDPVAPRSDRQLFAALLERGQRSALFLRQPKPRSIEEQYYGEHGLTFFYLRMPSEVPDEIARVEMPTWIAQDGQRVDLLHALLVDQCRRGLGYPLAIMEAHEQAVIPAPEREAFRRLLEAEVTAEGFSAATSAKALSKRGRWL